MEHTQVSLAHGNGGRFMRELIDEIFVRHLANEWLDTRVDAARIVLDAGVDVLVTTDGFTVDPLEFPGGDIGSLAVHGTVNDLSVAGAVPRYLTVSAFIEEGLPIDQLERLVASLGAAARAQEVAVVAGDTKVVGRGEGGGLYLTTTGIGTRDRSIRLGMDFIQPGDRILVSGPLGDHGAAVMLAREQFGLRGDLKSDCASVAGITRRLTPVPGLRFMRDPTRGGLASVMHEIVHGTDLAVRLFDDAIPVRDSVRSVCEMLGYDPLYLACEGRVVAVVAAQSADEALAALRGESDGARGEIVGTVEQDTPRVIVVTELGGERLLEELEDSPLPRIC